MTLLDALAGVVDSQILKGVRAADGSMAHQAYFAFTDAGDVAYLSHLALEELVPRLEAWCRERRIEMGPVQ